MLIQEYSDVSVVRSRFRTDIHCEWQWGAYFKLRPDVRELFPYINAAVKGARYSHRPLHVRFRHRESYCTLYPGEAMAAPFKGRDHAIEFIESLIDFLNDLHDRRAELQPCYKIHRKPASTVDILKALPRTNCKKCGFPTCLAFAAALGKGDATPEACPDFVKPIAVYTVYPVIGENGLVASTFSIESSGDPAACRPKEASDPEPAPVSRKEKGGNGGPKKDLFDLHGIRIQSDLTPRETQVLRLLAEGASNPDISGRLNISPHTVKSHVIHIFNKLNVNDRTQAAVWAVRNQVV